MNEPLLFTDREEFLAELRRLREQGHDGRTLQVLLPYHLPEAEEILAVPAGGLRYFAFFGALSGFLAGLGLAALTSLSWPLIVGGKPIVSWPPFLLIGYILTILFGSLAAFAGYLLLAARSGRGRRQPLPEPDNRFVIVVEGPPWNR